MSSRILLNVVLQKWKISLIVSRRKLKMLFWSS